MLCAMNGLIQEMFGTWVAWLAFWADPVPGIDYPSMG